MGTRPHLGKLECPTALSGDGDLLKSGQRVHSKWHGMKVVSRQARWQNPHSPPSPGNAVCSWLNGVAEVCTHFQPFGKFFVKRSNGNPEQTRRQSYSMKNTASSSCLQIVTPRLSTVNTESRNTWQPWINGLLSASHRNIELAVRAKSLAPAIGYGTPTRFLSPPDTRFHLTQKLLAHGTRVIHHAAGFSKGRATI